MSQYPPSHKASADKYSSKIQAWIEDDDWFNFTLPRGSFSVWQSNSTKYYRIKYNYLGIIEIWTLYYESLKKAKIAAIEQLKEISQETLKEIEK